MHFTAVASETVKFTEIFIMEAKKAWDNQQNRSKKGEQRHQRTKRKHTMLVGIGQDDVGDEVVSSPTLSAF